MKIEVTLNGELVHGRPGMTILELARERSVDIPTLCHHPDLTPAGVCRLCVVEVEGWRTLLPSCQTPISPGMVIRTHSARVVSARRTLLELILASHPDVCLVCDKGNRCELRQAAASLEITMPRLRMKRHYHPAEDASQHVVRDLSKCILCRRCVRACHEIKKADILAPGYRGFDSKVIAGRDRPLEAEVCQSCDVCLSVCPVGALQKREDAAHAGAGACGRLPQHGLSELARDSGVPMVEVYAAASFYRHPGMAPAGRHVVRICQGVPCYLRRNLPVIAAIREALGIAPGETSPDGLFSLELVNCIGACDQAPAMMIDGDLFGHLTPESVIRILEGYR